MKTCDQHDDNVYNHNGGVEGFPSGHCTHSARTIQAGAIPVQPGIPSFQGGRVQDGVFNA